MIHKVALVLDPSFGEKIRDIADQMHVWLVASPENSFSAKAFWDEQSEAYSQLRGVTTFPTKDPTSRAQNLNDILPTIDEHHQGERDVPAWSQLHVYGLTSAEVDSSVLESLELNRLEPTSFGFIAFADEPDG